MPSPSKALGPTPPPEIQTITDYQAGGKRFRIVIDGIFECKEEELTAMNRHLVKLQDWKANEKSRERARKNAQELLVSLIGPGSGSTTEAQADIKATEDFIDAALRRIRPPALGTKVRRSR